MFEQLHGTRAVLTDPSTKALFDYWNALRNGRAAPIRREVDPVALRTILPRIFMLEMVDANHAIFRIAGTALCAAFGREFRDHNFVELWDRESRRDVLTLVQRVVERCEVGLIDAEAATLDRTVIKGEFLLLPLSDVNGHRTRLIGVAGCGERLERLGWRKLVRLSAKSTVAVDPAATAVAFRGEDNERPTPAMRPPLAIVKPTSLSQKGATPPMRPVAVNPWRERLRLLLQLDE